MSTFLKTHNVERGATLPGAGLDVSTTDLFKPELEGQVRWDEDRDYSVTNKPLLSSEQVKLRLVRNMTNANILPSQTVVIDKLNPGRTTTALAGADVEFGAIADDFLPAAGARPGELFYVIESGPCRAIAAGAVAAGADIGTAATGKTDDAAATKKLGVALAAAAADGDKYRAYIRPNFR